MNITAGSIAKVICGIFVFYAIVHLQSLIVSVLVAVIVASFIEPLILFFVRRGASRGASVFLSYSLIVVVILSFIFLALPPLIRETFSAINSLPTSIKTADVLDPIQKSLYTVAKNIFPDIPQRISIEDLVSLITSSFSNFVGGVFDTVSRFFGGIITFVLVLVLSVYLSIEHRGVARFLGMVTPKQYEKYVIELWNRVQIKIGRWIQGQFILMGIMFLIVFITLSICKLFLGDQIQHIFLLSILAGLLEFIPVIGIIISTIIAFLFTLLNGGMPVALLVVILFTLINQIESHIIYPMVMKKITGVHPLLVIVSLVAGIQLAGFVGVLLSIPVAVLIVEYLDDHNRRKQMIENASREGEEGVLL